jgi:hypothetical protein
MGEAMVTKDYGAIDVGDEAPGVEVHFTLDEVRTFLSIQGQQNRDSRFTNPEVAAREGFGAKAVVPGRMGLAYLARAIKEWLPDGRIEKLDVVFRSPTVQNTKHRAGGIVTDRSEKDGSIVLEMDVYLETEDGQRPQRGAATVYLPKR